MADTERMAVELTVFVDVPADITEPDMVTRALEIVSDIRNGYDPHVDDASGPMPYLVPRPLTDEEKRAFVDADSLFVDTQDAATRYQEHPEGDQ